MINSSKKVLIAGCTGFIGKEIIKHLHLNGFTNLIPLSRSNGHDLLLDVKPESFKCDVVINLAGIIGIDNSWKSPEKFYKENFLITLNLLNIAKENGAHFIHFSSYVYGIPQYQPIDEKHTVKGYNPYSSSKIISENVCIDYANYFNIPVTILRPFNVYGIGQSKDFLISKLVDSAIKGYNVDVFDTAAKRDYLWVGDIANGVVKIINKKNHGLDIYNMGSGCSYSAEDIVNVISKHIPSIKKNVNSKGGVLNIRDCVCDSSLFSKDFDWTPKVGLELGIDALINSATT